MRTLLAKLLTRIAFIGLLIIIVPLAVQNRQPVDLTLNPIAALTGDTGAAFTLPLFIALLLALGVGLLVGLGLAHLSRARLFKRKDPSLAQTTPPILPDAPDMLEEPPKQGKNHE